MGTDTRVGSEPELPVNSYHPLNPAAAMITIWLRVSTTGEFVGVSRGSIEKENKSRRAGGSPWSVSHLMGHLLSTTGTRTSFDDAVSNDAMINWAGTCLL